MTRNRAKNAKVSWPKSFRVFRSLSLCSCSKPCTFGAIGSYFFPFLSLMQKISKTHYRGLMLTIIVYLSLSLTYFFIVPIFEGPDEWTHSGHVKYIAEGNGLPIMLPGRGIWGGQQPPLYFATAAILMQPFDLSGLDRYEKSLKNPHASLGYALDPGNKNHYLHHPAENFPYHGLSLAVHILRLYSMAFGLVTLIFTYLTASDFGFWILDFGFSDSLNLKSKIQNPKYFAPTVALFVACQPMFAFITAMVANEPTNMAGCAVALWLTQRYVLYGPSLHWKRAVALGVTFGLISLAKMTGLSIGLVMVMAFLQVAITRRNQPGVARLLWRDGFIIGFSFLLIGGWWYWRNYQLYGDFFQTGLYEIYFHDTPDPITLSHFLYILSSGEVSFWATFGWLNIVAPDWFYNIYYLISRIGLLGTILSILAVLLPQKLRCLRNCPLLIHLIFPPILAFSLTRLVAIEGGMQGRQLLPALGSMAIVITWGWFYLAETFHRILNRLHFSAIVLRLTFYALPLFLFGLAIWLPFNVVAPAYIPRPLLTESDLPADLHRLNLTYQNELKLIGVTIGTTMVRPGERVTVTAYWQALHSMTTNYSVFVHLMGRQYQNIGQLNSYPSLGLRPTTTLESGQIVADTYPVQVNGGSEAPTRLLVNIGLFNFNEPGRPGITALNPDGSLASSTVGQLKLIPTVWSTPSPQKAIAQFGDTIELLNYSLDSCQHQTDSCRITFNWLAQGQPPHDYTVFIQLWQNGAQISGFDAPPLSGDYPTTMWAAHETIFDPHALNLAAIPIGQYEILTGLYNLATGERLSVQANGKPLPNNALNLGTMEIKSP